MSAPAFDRLLADAMERRGLSLGRIRRDLKRRGHDVSVASLSYWRRGLSRPTRARSREAVAALEEILQVPSGALVRALDLERAEGGDTVPGLEALAARLDMSWDASARRVSIHDSLRLDDRGMPAVHRVRETFLAREDGMRRYPVAYYLDDDPAARVDHRALAHCEVGRRVRSDGLVLVEMVLPQPLAAGQAWMIEHEARTDGASRPQDAWGRHLRQVLRDLHVCVRFDPACVPSGVQVTTEERGQTARRPLVLRGPSLDLHLVDVGPGNVGISWTW